MGASSSWGSDLEDINRPDNCESRKLNGKTKAQAAAKGCDMA